MELSTIIIYRNHESWRGGYTVRMYFYDDFFLIILLVGLALTSAPISLFVALSARRRTRALERNFAELTALISRMAIATPSVTLSDAARTPDAPPPVAEDVERLKEEALAKTPEAGSPAMLSFAPEEPSRLERFLAWYREDWMQKTGAIVMFFGFLWLVGYINAWEKIGPAGQVTFGLLSGAAFLVFGWWRMQRFVNQGGTFMLLGSGIVLMTVFISRNVYPDMFDPRVAALVMLASVALVALAAVKYNRQPFAFVAQIAAFGIPFLTVSSRDDMMLFTYLLLVTAGTLWVVWYKGWRDLIVAALIFVGLYSVQYWLGGLSDDRLLLYGYLFSAIFFLAFAVSIVRRGPSASRMTDIVAILGNGVFILMWILSGVDEEWQSLVLAFWATLFASGAYVTSLVSGRRDPFYLHGAVAIAMLGAATAAELDGASLTIAFTLEIVLLAVAAHLYTKRIEASEKLSLLLIIPGVLSFMHLDEYIASSYWMEEKPLFGLEFFAVAIFIAAVALLGGYLRTQRTPGEGTKHSSILLGIASTYALVFFWYFIHKAYAGDSHATLVALVLYTILGIYLYTIGRLRSSTALGWFGKGLILFVLARIFLIDLWSLELATRITIAFAVGALLMATAFLRKK